jgi:hypothetical protein
MIEERVPRAEIIFERFSNEERLCVIYSLRCNLECGHCNVSSSPHRQERLTLEEALEALRDGAALGKRHVTFSGGEIFIYYKDLVVMVAEAGRLGYEVDVETNAYFATSPEAAEAKLRPLAETGLRGMCLSCDAYHVDYFELDRQFNAYRAGLKLGLLVEVNFCPSERPEVDAEIRRRLTEEKIPFLENSLLNRGRARDSSLVALGRAPANLPPCDSLNTTIHPVGDVFACCELEADNPRMRRTPVFLGNLRHQPGLLRDSGDGEKLIEAFYDPDSPAFFKRLLETEPAFAGLRSQRFLSICDFCMTALADDSCVSAARAALGRATE